jgi:hypothetical protein
VGVVGAYLSPTVGRQLDAVVGNELVNVSVFVPFGLGMSDQNYHLFIALAPLCTWLISTVYLPEVCP